MTREERTETLTFAELVAGTDAEYFEQEGYDILDFDWVEGGLKITALEPEGLAKTPENSVALADGRTPEEAERIREELEDFTDRNGL